MINPGARLAHYEILSALGKGGMGEVWRARDARLGRDVAIKTLPPDLAGDDGRIARFEREARLLAALNHPNIAAIHGFEEDSGTHFLVLELVEGDTLADRLRLGAIPVEEALRLALQIAEALESAHEKGIVHRDLKPANIKVTKDGRVKVLDFGLAKPFYDVAGAGSEAPTQTHATEKGVILGTPAYMSPEQVRGEAVDPRTDIWAFGAVLSEMLTGRSLFQAGTSAETFARVLAPTPVERSLPEDTPPLVARLIRRCLRQKPGDRLRHIGDAKMDLQEAVSAPDAPAGEDARSTTAARLRRLGMIAAALAIAVAAGWFGADAYDDPRTVEHYDITAIQRLSGFVPENRILAISPDGSRVAYSTSGALYVYSVNSRESLRPGAGVEPFFSPDSKSLAFFDNNGNLVRVSVEGGPPTVVAATTQTQTRNLGGDWSSDGRIVFATIEGVYLVPENGGEPERVIAPDRAKGELSFGWPEVLPGNRTVLFTIAPTDAANGSQIAVLDLETRTYQVLIHAGSRARYTEAGHIVYAEAGQLKAVAFDPRSRRLESEPIVLSYRTRPGAPSFDVSANGTLVFLPPVSPPNTTLVWVDPRDGSEEPAGLPRTYIYPRLSPDGRKVIGDATVNGNRDLYIWDFERQIETQLTTDPREDLFALWSADSRTVYFTSNRNGRMELFSMPADRSAPATLVYGDPKTQHWLMDILPGGSELLAMTGAFGTEFVTLTLTGAPKVSRILSLEAGGLNSVVSPNGGLLAYQSNETGQTEVWVRSLSGANQAQRQASRNGGRNPRWSLDGRTLYYQDFKGAMSAVQVRYEPEFGLGAVTEVFPNRGYTGAVTGPIVPNAGRAYDIARDGRFLMPKSEPTETANNIRVVLNFFEEIQ